MAGLSLMDSLFQRTLEDLIKGIRLHQGSGAASESAFISKSLNEIRREIKSTDAQTKGMALQKLTYLHSLYGVDMSWAAFNSIELSSSTLFHSKRLAYLAASLSFNPDTTDVILLLTHQLRKDLTSSNHHEVSLALHTLSFIATPDLSRDLTPELFTLLNSSKSFVKKKAIATMLRLFSQYPESVRVCFKRLVENLESSDVGVVSAVVGVFCEIACKEPRAYLPLAPEFYKLLVDSRNNWVLIKVLKIFAKLAPLEPRLGKRLVEPICEHLRRTGAKSLAFECIRTILSSLSEQEAAVKLAVEKVREFLMNDDPNLKYLGLQALTIVTPNHMWAVLENKEFVIRALSDSDGNIKLEALRLVMEMVSEDNVVEICRVLMSYALKSDPEFCNEILGSILSTCSRNYYEIINDFDWYVSLLSEMSRILQCQKGEEIENQLIDIGMRVKDVRPALVRVGRELLIDPALLGNPFIHRILSAAAWVSGEYVDFSKNPFELIEALLQPRTSLLPPSIRAVYIQSAFKILTFCLYAYFCQKEATTSSALGIVDSTRESELSEKSDRSEPFADSDPDESFNPRGEQSEDGENPVAAYRQTYSASLKMVHVTEESILNILNLVDLTLSPFGGSHEVETKERVRNILGLVELIRQEIPSYSPHNEGADNQGELKAPKVIKLMRNAFSEELGPVSMSAQEKVPIPDGLVLKENLGDLDSICSNINLPVSTSFSLIRRHPVENDPLSFSENQKREESEPSTESTSLLAEHCKRHGLYYLPSEKKEVVSSDYPPANDPSVQDNVDADAEDLVKLTEQSLVSKKKPNQTKSRPVVVKLDDGERISIAPKKQEPEDNLISGAVRDVLLGIEAVPSSSVSNKSNRKSSKCREKEKLTADKHLELHEDYTNMTSSESGIIGSESKHCSRSKEKKHRSLRKEKGEHDQKDKQKSSHRHSKHKSRHRAERPVDVAAKPPVIPDFLL